MLFDIVVVAAGLETVVLVFVASSLEEVALGSVNDTSSKLLLALLVRDAHVAESNDERCPLEEGVHLLECASLGLGKDEVEGESVGEATDGEEKVVLPADAYKRFGSDLANHEVGNPATDTGKSGTLGSNGSVHNLDWYSPRKRPYAGTEKEVKDPDHGDEGTASMFVGSRTVGGVSSLECGCDGETGTGHGVADNEGPSTTELVDKENTGSFADEGDNRVDTLEQEDLGVAVAKDLEDVGSVVLNCSNTGDLDGELKNDTNSDLANVLLAAEDLAPAASSTLLNGKLSLDLGKLCTNKDIGGVAAGVKASERAESILFAALGHEPSRRFREEHDKESEGNGRGDLETEGESPLEDGIFLVNAAAVDDETGNEGTDTEEKLLESGESASDGRVGNFRLIKGSKEGKHSDTDTGEETTGHHHALVSGSSLKDTADDEDDGTDHDSEATRESIGNEGSRDTTDEGTEQHGTNDETDVVFAWVVGDIKEVLGDNDTRNDTEIVTEKD